MSEQSELGRFTGEYLSVVAKTTFKLANLLVEKGLIAEEERDLLHAEFLAEVKAVTSSGGGDALK